MVGIQMWRESEYDRNTLYEILNRSIEIFFNSESRPFFS